MRFPTAVVLGGGGVLGAVQIGMLRALAEAGVRPDVVLGTSVGAINGAVFALEPGVAAVDRLDELWRSAEAGSIFDAGTVSRIRTLAGSGTHLHGNDPLRSLLVRHLDDRRIEDLPVHFECCAASVERAAERWFTSGPVVPAVLASSAAPGLLPPVQVDGEHYLDGGLVNSIPVGRAVELGAERIFVLQVGRIDDPLRVPRRPWEVGLVAFEIARRHRFARDMAAVPAGTEVHVLPVGAERPGRFDQLASLRYRDFERTARRIDSAYRASVDYLREQAVSEP